MMGSSRAVAAVMASLLVATPVLAQPKPPSDKEKQQAGELVKKAIAKGQAGDHQTAIDLYDQAYKLIPDPPYGPPLLTNIGNEYLALDKPVEALKYFCKYLDTDPNGGMADFARAQAKVTQDKLGNHDVPEKDVCKPIPPPVDHSHDHDTVVQPPPPLPPQPPPSGMSKLQIAGLGVAGAGLVSLIVGAYFGKLAANDSDTITNHDPKTMWPDNISMIESEGQSYQNKQIAFMVVGGVALVGGVAMYILGRTSKSSTEVSLIPTKGGAGIAIGRAF
jgi:tetratricopeptide (TPR) repeat protein